MEAGECDGTSTLLSLSFGCEQKDSVVFSYNKLKLHIQTVRAWFSFLPPFFLRPPFFSGVSAQAPKHTTHCAWLRPPSLRLHLCAVTFCATNKQPCTVPLYLDYTYDITINRQTSAYNREGLHSFHIVVTGTFSTVSALPEVTCLHCIYFPYSTSNFFPSQFALIATV